MLQVYSCWLLQPPYLDCFFQFCLLWLPVDSPTNITFFVTSTPSTSLQTLVSSGGRGCGDEALGTRVGDSGAGGAAWCPHSLTRPHIAIPSEANQAGLGLVTRAGHNSPLPHAAAGPGQGPCLSRKSSQQRTIKIRKSGYSHDCNIAQALACGP